MKLLVGGCLMMFVVVLMVGLVVGAPSLYAQQDQDWKTYYKPLSYTIDYPTVNGTANITETEIEGHPTTLIESEPVFMIITQSVSYPIDPEEMAIMHKQNYFKVSPESTILQDMFTSTYDGEIGYTYVTNNRPIQAIISHSMITSGIFTYDINLMGMAYNPETIDNFNNILGSIKFFD